MRSYFVTIYMLVFCAAKAQQAKPAELKQKWSGSLTGAILPLPKLNVGIQPGVSYRFNERFSFSTEITLRVGNKTDEDSNAINKKYFRIQPEFRYYFQGSGKRRETYTGMRIAWTSRKFEDQKGFYADRYRGDSGYFFDHAKISSPVTTVSLQAGTIFPFGSNLGLDLFAGIGARFVNTDYYEVQNPLRGKDIPSPAFSVRASYGAEGKVTLFHFNMGFRFLYHFGQ